MSRFIDSPLNMRNSPYPTYSDKGYFDLHICINMYSFELMVKLVTVSCECALHIFPLAICFKISLFICLPYAFQHPFPFLPNPLTSLYHNRSNYMGLFCRLKGTNSYAKFTIIVYTKFNKGGNLWDYLID